MAEYVNGDKTNRCLMCNVPIAEDRHVCTQCEKGDIEAIREEELKLMHWLLKKSGPQKGKKYVKSINVLLGKNKRG